VLAVIEVPEMKQELAEAKAELEVRKSSLESARRQLDHNKANVALQNALSKDREQLGEGRGFISDRTLDQVHATAEIAKADLALLKANRASPPTRSTSPQRPWRRSRFCSPIRRSWRLSMAWWRGPGEPGRFGPGRNGHTDDAVAGHLYTVQRIATIRVFCDIPRTTCLTFHIGDPAIVNSVWLLDGKPFIGKVTRFSLRLDPGTRNMRTEIDLTQPEERLYPGTYARSHWK